MNNRSRSSNKSNGDTPKSFESKINSNNNNNSGHSRSRSSKSRAQVEALEARAAREVIEDSETWDDVSDDENFKKKVIDEGSGSRNHSSSSIFLHNQPSSSRIKPIRSESSSSNILTINNLRSKTTDDQKAQQRWSEPFKNPNRASPGPPTSGSNFNGRGSRESHHKSSNQISGSPASNFSPAGGIDQTDNSSPPTPKNSKFPDRSPALGQAFSPVENNHPSKSPPPDSPSSSTFQNPIKPNHDENQSGIRQNVEELVRDPAYALSRLKLSLDDEENVINEENEPTSSNTPLPWNAVIPAEMMTSKDSSISSAGSDSGTPSPQRKSSTDLDRDPNYHRLPDTPSQNKKITPQEIKKQRKFLECLEKPTVNVGELRKLSWSGIPDRLRPIVWQILLGYLPAPAERRVTVLSRKRQEYIDAVRLAFGRGDDGLDQTIWHQIKIDVARTNPGVSLWQFPATQRSLERILYVWAIRHPASGYVQGINDLVTPFIQVFLSNYITTDPEKFDISKLNKEVLESIEADSFWCLSKLLEGIQDNYIFAQPGIQRQVARMKELCERVDLRLYQHLEEEKVEFIQFAFRWINCLLMRELSTKKIIRMWDTYLAEGTAAFSEFHLYVCLAFLVKYSDKLRSMDFQSIIIFLQKLPTEDWNEKDIELLLSQAFMWHSLFQGATGHFVRK